MTKWIIDIVNYIRSYWWPWITVWCELQLPITQLIGGQSAYPLTTQRPDMICGSGCWRHQPPIVQIHATLGYCCKHLSKWTPTTFLPLCLLTLVVVSDVNTSTDWFVSSRGRLPDIQLVSESKCSNNIIADAQAMIIVAPSCSFS